MQEYYYELNVEVQENREIFIDILYELTQDTIEEREKALIIRSQEDLKDISWAIEEFAKKLNTKIKTTLNKLKNEDWVNKYKDSIQPIEVGSFYIRPEWNEPKEGFHDIIINPALAFGSGHHETTSSCLKAIQTYVKENQSLLDVGCGSGILAIAANKLKANVDICDTDPLAIDSAKDNFTLNNAQFNNSWVGSAAKTDQEYDIVIANIIADVLLMIHKDLKVVTKHGGILILSGIIDKYINKIKEKYKDFNIIENITEGEWHTLVLQKQ
jgi:ribosomal protein L11 methyltransferase